MLFLIIVIYIFYIQEKAEKCFASTYAQKLIDLYSDVATGLQTIIRSQSRANNVTQLYNIEIIPLTEELPRLKNVEVDGSIAKSVCLQFLYMYSGTCFNMFYYLIPVILLQAQVEIKQT